ncbi:MAG: response regulator [Planctomycetes bacterium]|nr:response regulator [Planctomycetota bacterium]
MERRAARAESALAAERKRRKAEARRSLLSAMVTDLASGFVNAPSDAVDRAIAQALQELCHAVDGDRVLLSMWDASNSRLRWGASWSRSGIPSASGRGAETPLGPIESWKECAIEGRILEIPSLASLPPHDPLAAYMKENAIGSMLALPLMEEERCTGFLVLETHQRTTTWGHDEFSALVVAAELFANSAMRRQHEAALEKALGDARSALRARDAFLANLSHELRTPMNGVLGMAQLLQGANLPRAQYEQVEAIQRSAGQLQRQLGDLLEFTRLDSGDAQIHRVAVDLRQLISRAIGAAPQSEDRRTPHITTAIEQSVPRLLLADGERLASVVSALLDNACTHASGSRICVAASYARPLLRISVTDTGAGMDEHTYARLFEPFVRADTSDSRRTYGLGLGLAIAKRSCRLMHGDLQATSVPGKGSSFLIELPADEVEEAVAGPEMAKPGIGIRVLVADYGAVNRIQLQRMLLELGCSVDTTEDGIDAVQKALASPYAMIFLNPAMPRMDGLAAARAIRGGETRMARRRARIVALPSASGPESDERIRAAGIDLRLEREPTPSMLAGLLAEGAVGTSAGPGRKSTVLIVDDNAVNLRLLSLMVSQAGYPTETCCDGRAAAERVAAGGISLVLMDCQMPVMDGYESTRLIRSDEGKRGLPRTPIVAVTAHAMSENRQRCKECGMDGFLTKPIDTKLLLSTVATYHPGGATSQPTSRAAAARATSDPPIDLSTLRQLEEASPGAGRDIARTMVADLAAARDLLPALLRQQDLGRLAKEAHKLKGAAGSIGGGDVAKACAALEQAARTSDADACATALDAVIMRSHPFAASLADYAGGRC